MPEFNVCLFFHCYFKFSLELQVYENNGSNCLFCKVYMSLRLKEYSHLIPISTSLSLFQYKIVNKYNTCDRKNTREELFHVYYLCSSHKNLLEPRRGFCSIKRWPTFEATGARGNPEFYSCLGQSTRDTSTFPGHFIRPPGVYNASLMKFKMIMKFNSHQAVNYPLWGPLRICLENVRSLKAFKITHYFFFK